MTTQTAIVAPCPTWCTLLPGHEPSEVSRRHVGMTQTILLSDHDAGDGKRERSVVIETYAYQEEDGVCPAPTTSVFGGSAWGDELDDLTASDLKQLVERTAKGLRTVQTLGGEQSVSTEDELCTAVPRRGNGGGATLL